MTRIEHHKLAAKERIDRANSLRDCLVATADALANLLNCDDEHLLSCKHVGPTIDDLENAQRDLEAAQAQLSALESTVSTIPDDQREFVRASAILPLKDKIRHIEEGISDIQSEMEELQEQSS